MRTSWNCLLALCLASAPALAEAPPGPSAGKGKAAKGETRDEILQEAAAAGERPSEAGKPADAVASGNQVGGAAPAKGAEAASPRAGGKGEKHAGPGAKATTPSAPPTDDNDATGEATRPKALVAVAGTDKPRVRGPYELGPLDCRVLDGAGIERILPSRIVAGEEPDLLCRTVVTQPPTVATQAHELTLSVYVGQRETFHQTRNVRMSSIGRRALVFVVPADRIATYDPATVKIQALLSAPADPPTGRHVKFTVESED